MREVACLPAWQPRAAGKPCLPLRGGESPHPSLPPKVGEGDATGENAQGEASIKAK